MQKLESEGGNLAKRKETTVNRYALVNARVFTISSEVIENGAILINKGLIEKVGGREIVPDGVKCFDLNGASVLPGIIDAHCHVGVFNEGVGDIGSDGNEYGDPLTPDIKAVDGIYTDDEAFFDAISHGITTLCIGPGSANVIGGQMAVVKIRSNILEEMVIDDYVGLKCAFGENPKRVYGSKGKLPFTRMGVAATLRKAFNEAKNYKAERDYHMAKPEKEGEPKAPFKRDASKEIILEVLEGKKPIRAHAHRADDIQTAIRIANEYGVRINIEHATEGHKIANYIAGKGISIIIGPLNYSKTKVELRDGTMDAPKILEDAGVHFAVMTDAPVKKIGNLFDDIRLCVRHGVSKETALKSVTLHPAQILGMESRLGTIEAGKDADLVVFNGDPFDFMSTVSATIIDGKVLFGALPK